MCRHPSTDMGRSDEVRVQADREGKVPECVAGAEAHRLIQECKDKSAVCTVGSAGQIVSYSGREAEDRSTLRVKVTLDIERARKSFERVVVAGNKAGRGFHIDEVGKLRPLWNRVRLYNSLT